MLVAMNLASRGLPAFRPLASGLLAALLAGAGCHDDEGPGEDTDTGGEYEQGVETPASGHAPAASCPPGAPVLGDSGPIERFDLPWASNGAQSYVGDYQYFVIPDDILSLLIAVEHGAEYTALNHMAIDGEPM